MQKFYTRIGQITGDVIMVEAITSGTPSLRR
jgi:hypothetical protein